MNALPHFKVSNTGLRSYEPIYSNIFDVKIVYPAAIRSAVQEDSALILEGVISVKGLQTLEKSGGVLTQTFKGSQRSFSKGMTENTFVDFSIAFEVNLNDENQMYTYNALRAWCDLVYNPLTSSQSPARVYKGTAEDPTQVIIQNYSKDFKMIREVTLTQCFPIEPLPVIDEYHYDKKDSIYRIDSLKFRADTFDDVVRKR